jgi:hypothetical protein
MRQVKSTRHHEGIRDGNVEASGRLAAVAVERTQLGCHPYAHEVTTNKIISGPTPVPLCHRHTRTLRKPIRLRRSSWSPVRTGMWRQDRRPCHDLPGVRLGVACKAGRCRLLDVTAACHARPSRSFSGSPDFQYIFSGRSVGTRHWVVSGASGSAGSTFARRSQAGQRSPEVSRTLIEVRAAPEPPRGGQLAPMDLLTTASGSTPDRRLCAYRGTRKPQYVGGYVAARPRGRQSVPTCRARIDGLATICPAYDSEMPGGARWRPLDGHGSFPCSSWLLLAFSRSPDS